MSNTVVRDRFQPWITADAAGLHAMWYERVGSLVQTSGLRWCVRKDASGRR